MLSNTAPPSSHQTSPSSSTDSSEADSPWEPRDAEAITPELQSQILNAEILFKQFATGLNFSGLPQPIVKTFEKWRQKSLSLEKNSSFKTQAAIYKRLQKFKELIDTLDDATEGAYQRIFNRISYLPQELTLFLKLCDRVSLKKLSEPKLKPGAKNPLFCFPKSLFYRTAAELNHSVMRTFPLLPTLDSGSLILNNDYFKKTLSATSCISCESSETKNIFKKILNKDIKIDLMVNPFLRDFSLTYLNSKLTKNSKKSFHPVLPPNQAKPFKIMQKLICDFEQEIKRLTDGSGTILGDFLPTSAEETGVPLFRRPDGQLLGFFWHGTSIENADKIGETSLLLDMGVTSAYGQGLYLTPQVCTAAKYAYKGERAKDISLGSLVLTAVFLGNHPYIINAPIVRGGKVDKKAPVTFVIPGISSTLDDDIIVIVPHEAQIVPLLKFQFLNADSYSQLESKQLQEGCTIS